VLVSMLVLVLVARSVTAAGAASIRLASWRSFLVISPRQKSSSDRHLALFEMSSSVPNRRYANGLRRLGFDGAATEFYDEHVVADAVHESVAAVDLALDPALKARLDELTQEYRMGDAAR